MHFAHQVLRRALTHRLTRSGHDPKNQAREQLENGFGDLRSSSTVQTRSASIPGLQSG
jgi:hypothetical protein